MSLDKHSLVTILDGDTIPWIVAYNHRDKDDVDKALQNVDEYVLSLLKNTNCTHYCGFLGGEKCFRYEIAKHKPYKGQRPTPPDWYKKWGGVMKAHLRDKWKFQVVNGIEADDAVSIVANRLRGLGINHILCHADKDIYQVHGNHYNLRTHKRIYIDELVGLKTLYKQVLKGDVSDNIEGCKGIGDKGASKAIDELFLVSDMINNCKQLFIKKYGDAKGIELFYENLMLCELLVHREDLEVEYHKFDRSIKEEKQDITLEDLKDIWG